MTEFDCFMDEVMVIGQGIGGNPDWNQNDDTAPDYIKNRTHYEETIVTNEPLNLTWDGNTEGLVSVFDMFYKVSDLVLTDEQIKLGTIYANTGESMSILDVWDYCVAEGTVTTDAVSIGDVMLFVRKDGAMLYDTIIPEQGIYFMSTNDAYISAFTTIEPVELTKTVVHKLDPKYLPETTKPDWNQNDETQPDYIKNRTHYKIADFEDVTWDGNDTDCGIDMGGDEFYYEHYYKVSDIIPTIEQLMGAVVTIKDYSGLSNITLDISNITDNTNTGTITCLNNNGYGLLKVVYDSSKNTNTPATSNSIKNGLYLHRSDIPHSGEERNSYVSKLSFIKEIKKLDEIYLPEVDQTYSSSSENAQSGKAVAEALSQISFDNLNIRNSMGEYSLQQIQDTKYTGIAIKTKNPNAYALDPTLTDEEPIGAPGEFATSFGGASSAQGKRSLAEGTNTIAKGKYSHVEGDNSVALGNDSHAENLNTVAKGTASHSEGSGSQAIGNSSHTEGVNTIAEGDASHAGGLGAIARGIHSFAHGNGVIASMDNQVAFGKFNTPTEALYVIGDGYDDNNRSNAFEVFGGYKQEKYATVGGQRLITEQQLTMVGEYFTQYIDTQTGKKTVAGEIIEITDLDNRQSTVIDSTVTDNYFYKENFIKSEVSFEIISPYIKPRLCLKNSKTGAKSKPVEFIRNKFDDGFVNYRTAYIVFKTPDGVSVYDSLEYSNHSGGTIDIPINTLKDENEYMLIIKISNGYEEEGAPSLVHNITYPYLVDYKDAYHWIKGTSVDNIPFPNSIMIPHIGRIDKGDTLTATYTTSEQYKAFFGIDENGNHYINIGNTKVTEAQIKKLLMLIS